MFLFSVSAAAIGISFIQFANNNSMRNHYILGLSLFLGISIPQYFVSNTQNGRGPVRTDGGWVSRIKNNAHLFFFSSLSLRHHEIPFCWSSATILYLDYQLNYQIFIQITLLPFTHFFLTAGRS